MECSFDIQKLNGAFNDKRLPYVGIMIISKILVFACGDYGPRL